MKAAKIKPTVCPYCGKITDHATHVTGSAKEPGPNTVFVCWDCAGISMYNAARDLEKITDEQLQEIKIISPKTWAALMGTQKAVEDIIQSRKIRDLFEATFQAKTNSDPNAQNN